MNHPGQPMDYAKSCYDREVESGGRGNTTFDGDCVLGQVRSSRHISGYPYRHSSDSAKRLLSFAKRQKF
jgi:hypothetical protein